MAVITISREFGSGGMDVAHQVAGALQCHFVDKRVIGRVLGQYGLAQFSDDYDSMPNFWERFDAQKMDRRDVMVDMLNRAILALAHHGQMVIVGRCGFAVLRGFADVLNVRLQAPLPDRIQRVMARQHLADRDQAGIVVHDEDKLRAAFVEWFYGLHADSARAFDLVIDTGKIPPEAAAAFISQAAQALPAQPPACGGRLTTAIEPDSILAAAVAYELKCETLHRQGAPGRGDTMDPT